MIRFTLRCDNDHRFESWFQSGSAFDRLVAGGHVACTVCGSEKVEKAMMAPQVNSGEASEAPEEAKPPRLQQPASKAEEALAEFRRKVEESSDYVGGDFAREARAIHDGEAPERAIYGEARVDEARKLLEDGVPVAPLPFLPNRKAN